MKITLILALLMLSAGAWGQSYQQKAFQSAREYAVANKALCELDRADAEMGVKLGCVNYSQWTIAAIMDSSFAFAPRRYSVTAVIEPEPLVPFQWHWVEIYNGAGPAGLAIADPLAKEEK